MLPQLQKTVGCCTGWTAAAELEGRVEGSSGGEDEGEGEEDVEGNGEGRGGDMLQMHRHCKPSSFLHRLLGHKETLKKIL